MATVTEACIFSQIKAVACADVGGRACEAGCAGGGGAYEMEEK